MKPLEHNATAQAVIAGLLFGLLLAPTSRAWSADAPSVKALQSIEISIREEHLQTLAPRLDINDLQRQIASNLREWQFPVGAAAPYSHRLVAEIGQISRQSTPVGFSFSQGNSDPRAGDFQKADVLPIRCSLYDAQTQTPVVSRESTFAAHPYDGEHSAASVRDKLIDHISTACLETLEHAPQPKSEQQRASTSIFKPKWMPDLKIEVREQVESQPGNESNQAPEPRKQLIIHNQGSPVVIEMGYERR